MSIVFEKPNYTQIPNIYLDELMYVLSPTENTIMLFLMRKILGWHKEKDIISYSQIEKATGLSRPTVIKAVKVLEKTGLIKTKPTTKGVFIELVIYEKLLHGYYYDDFFRNKNIIKKQVDFKLFL